MHGKSTKNKIFKNVKPFWYSASLQRSYYSKQELPKVSDLEYWDSTLEFRVYQELLKYFHADLIKRQHEIVILPKEEPFKEWSWKVDFLIQSNKLIKPLYIECKGGWIKHDKGSEREFAHMLQTLQSQHSQIFKNLLIVSDSNWKLVNTKIEPISIEEISLKLIKKWRM
ncbi:MAG: hypothetical protein QNJ51_03055 [Calothrix sp. MO_167.B12]|nr:hypothetical protein [Calothrix sp. MO_167.B12]